MKNIIIIPHHFRLAHSNFPKVLRSTRNKYLSLLNKIHDMCNSSYVFQKSIPARVNVFLICFTNELDLKWKAKNGLLLSRHLLSVIKNTRTQYRERVSRANKRTCSVKLTEVTKLAGYLISSILRKVRACSVQIQPFDQLDNRVVK